VFSHSARAGSAPSFSRVSDTSIKNCFELTDDINREYSLSKENPNPKISDIKIGHIKGPPLTKYSTIYTSKIYYCELKMSFLV
jgi:hypothetical protein